MYYDVNDNKIYFIINILETIKVNGEKAVVTYKFEA